jgi:hypothetical protein
VSQGTENKKGKEKEERKKENKEVKKEICQMLRKDGLFYVAWCVP